MNQDTSSFESDLELVSLKIKELKTELGEIESAERELYTPQVISGAELNASGIKSIKFMNSSMVHHSYQYELGRNEELPGNFDPLAECQKGLFFVPEEWASFWCTRWDSVAEIEIPDEATVVIFGEACKMKSNIIIVKNITSKRNYAESKKDDSLQLFTKIPVLAERIPNLVGKLETFPKLRGRKSFISDELQKARLETCKIERCINIRKAAPNLAKEKVRRISPLCSYLEPELIDIAVQIASDLPPVPFDAYDKLLLKFKCIESDSTPSVNCIPGVLLTIHTLDRVLMMKHTSRGIACYDLPENFIRKNLGFFRSKVYWKAISRYLGIP